MKKMIIITAGILLIAVALTIFIKGTPQKIIVNRNLSCAQNTAYKGFTLAHWSKWSTKEFKITKLLLNSAEVETQDGEKGLVLLVFKSANTTSVRWQVNTTSNNFFNKKNIEKKINIAIDNLADFVADTKNTYGLRLTEGSTTDTNLIATRFVSPDYPSTEKIYNAIEKLRKFAANNNTIEVSHPMVNITAEYGAGYKCMVALPVRHKIISPENNQIFFTRMVPAKFLIGEINGGAASVQHAHEMIEEYLRDYQRTAMAIPFDYLITDRSKEKDTSKWVTRIYTPVF